VWLVTVLVTCDVENIMKGCLGSLVLLVFYLFYSDLFFSFQDVNVVEFAVYPFEFAFRNQE